MRVSFRFSDVRLAGVAFSKKQAIGGTGKLIEGVKRGAQSLGGFVRRCCFWLPVLLLASCATFEVTPFLREQITGDTWRACLARQYQAEARYQLRNGRHWTQASLLAAKGRQALDGVDPQPELPQPTLEERWQDLKGAIARHGRGCECGGAQAILDAWTVALDQDATRDQSPFARGFDKAVRDCNEGSAP